jgi:hypothetical protein
MANAKFRLGATPETTLRDWVRQLNYLFGNLDSVNVTVSTTDVINANSIDETMIDWGTGINQVSMSDIPIDPSYSPAFPTAKFGNSSHYSEFESDGTLKFVGDASVYRDELQSLLLQNLVSPAADIAVNSSEATLTFKQACNLSDYATMNVQVNHDWKTGTAVYPHIHWWQATSNVPNWLVKYRWQYNGQLASTDWSNSTRLAGIYTWSTGKLNQITGFTGITPTSDAKLSSILQLRLYRDGDNDSSSFGTTDLVSGNVETLNFDVHIQVDTIGSRLEYTK